MAKQTYYDFLNTSIEDMKSLTGKKRRLAAMALYLRDPDLSIEKVSEVLNYPLGTLKGWAEDDKWKQRRDEDKLKQIEELREEINKGKIGDLVTLFSNHLTRAINSSTDESIKIMDIADQKKNIEILKEVINMLEKLQLIDGATQKVQMEHKGSIEQNVNVSEYEKKLNKFEDMLNIISAPKEGEENGE